MKWELNGFKKGKIVRISIDDNFYHYGLLIKDDEVIQFGTKDDAFKKEAKAVEVNVCKLEDFGKGFIEVSKYSLKEKLIKNSTKKSINLALARLGEKGYDALKNNCEHFVNECVFNKHISYQVESIREKIKNKNEPNDKTKKSDAWSRTIRKNSEHKNL